MKTNLIAIHHIPGSFSDRWLEYCHENKVAYKLVDCNKPDIIKQLDGCAGLMWHWDLTNYRSYLFARQLTYSLVLKGIKVFPNRNTSWHYDDKVGQKYLLEAVDAPLVNSYVFYSGKDALNWADNTTFPKVFKLRGGAGSSNVKFVKNKLVAEKLIKKAFTSGYPHKNRIDRFKERIWVLQRDKNLAGIKHVLIGFVRFLVPKSNDKFYLNQKGYVYFQDFIPDNTFDTRIVIIGDRCFGAVRYCRTGDFRASGSGVFTYDPGLVNKKMIEISFEISKKIGSQSLAFDFVIDNDQPKIIEISYCFAIVCCDDAPGYWDRDLIWHTEEVNLQNYMIIDFINSLKVTKKIPLEKTKQPLDE